MTQDEARQRFKEWARENLFACSINSENLDLKAWNVALTLNEAKEAEQSAELTSLREEVERLRSQNELIGPLISNIEYVRDEIGKHREREANLLTDCLLSFWASYESTHINDVRKALDNTGEQNND